MMHRRPLRAYVSYAFYVQLAYREGRFVQPGVVYGEIEGRV